jgi:hypothetical protein
MWKCAKAELHRQIRCFPYVELFDVPWLQQVEKKSRRTAEECRTTSLGVFKKNKKTKIFSSFCDKLYELLSAHGGHRTFDNTTLLLWFINKN